MAARGTKRLSTSPAGSPKKKRPSNDCAGIAAALRKAQSPNETTSNMLASMVATSLGVYKDSRHAHQEEIVEMIGQAFNVHVTNLHSSINEFKAKVDGAGLEKSNRASALAAADVEVASAKARVDETQAAVVAARAEVSSAEKALKAAEDLQKSGDKDYNALAQKKKKVFEALEALNAVRESKPDGRALKLIKSVGTEFGIDKTMLNAVPTALNKQPAKRTSFDGVILDQVGAALKKILAEQSANVEAAEPAKAERMAAVDSAKQARDAAQAGLVARESTLSDTKAASKNCVAAQAAARKGVNNYVDDMKVIMDGYDEAKQDLINFNDGPLALFAEMKEKVTPPPEPSDEAAVEGKTESVIPAPAPSDEVSVQG